MCDKVQMDIEGAQEETTDSSLVKIIDGASQPAECDVGPGLLEENYTQQHQIRCSSVLFL
jgi:hypothetical protein